MKFKDFVKSLKKSFSKKNKAFPNNVDTQTIEQSEDILESPKSLESVSIKSLVIKDVVEEVDENVTKDVVEDFKKVELEKSSSVEINEDEVEVIEDKVDNLFVLQEGTICQLLDENILDVLLKKEEEKKTFINPFILISSFFSLMSIGISIFYNYFK